MKLIRETILLLIALAFFSINSFSQYYTPTQLSNIQSSRSAAEGDMYLDTVNKNYYIGLTTGEITPIGYIDSIFLKNDTLFLKQGDSTFFTPIKEYDGPWRNSNGTVATDTSTRINYLLGNVGIGNNNPLNKLEVTGNIGHTGTIRSVGATYTSNWMRFQEQQYGNSLVLGSGGNTILGGGEFANYAMPNFSAGNETLILGSDAGIRLFTNTQGGWVTRIEAMTILANGNIGMSVTNPLIKLDVAGKAQNTNARASVSLSTAITTTSTTFVDVPSMTVTVTTAVSDLLILVDIPGINNTSSDFSVNFQILVDGVKQGSMVEHENNSAYVWSSSLHSVVSVAAGSHTIKVQWSVQGGTGTINSAQSTVLGNRTLSVVEL